MLAEGAGRPPSGLPEEYDDIQERVLQVSLNSWTGRYHANAKRAESRFSRSLGTFMEPATAQSMGHNTESEQKSMSSLSWSY